ncbi:MAG: MFS transporter [Chloroflexi bacterium]|nr:MFS transporter [Chloroflexota bacterium]
MPCRRHRAQPAQQRNAQQQERGAAQQPPVRHRVATALPPRNRVQPCEPRGSRRARARPSPWGVPGLHSAPMTVTDETASDRPQAAARPGLRASFDGALRPRGRVFYGWWMVTIGAAVQGVIALLFNQAFGAYAVVLRSEFGWSRSALSAAFAMAGVESGLVGPVVGWLLDRFGPRNVMIAGVLLLGGGLVGFGFIQDLLMFYVVYFIMSLGATLSGFLAVTVALVSWFSRHRAKALGLTQIGFGIGGLLIPITVYAIERFGWRPTAIASGVLIWLAGIPLAALMRGRPEQYGDTPDGLPPAPTGAPRGVQAARAVAADGSEDFTTRQAMRTQGFWFISLGHSAALLIVSAVMVHLSLHLTENLGYTLTQASGFVALMTAAQLLGTVVGGILGDRFEKRIIATVCMAMHASALLLLAFATHWLMVVAFAVLHGWAWGTRGPLMQAIRADYFGTMSFGKIMGVSLLIVTVGSTVGPVLAGVLADRTGDYRAGFTVLAVGALLGSGFFVGARKPRPPQAPAQPSAARARAG